MGGLWGNVYRNYQHNPLLREGIKIPISHDELVKFLSFDNLKDLSIEALFTLHFRHSDVTPGQQMSPAGFSLNINNWLEMSRDEINIKTIKAYDTIINTFSLENLGDHLFNKPFTIEFLLDRGKGIDFNFIEQYSHLGISENKITFIPNHPYGLKNAISSLITYLYFFPDTFYVIKQGGSNFMFGDIFNIHSPEYVADSGYSDIIEGAFMWSGDGSTNGLNRENYNNLITAFSGNYNDRDVHYLLGFDNADIVGLLLSSFQTMFREQVDAHIFIRDLRIGSSNNLLGDFPFRLKDAYFKESLIQELISQGIIDSEIGLSGVTENRGIQSPKYNEPSRIIWVDERDFQHILDGHTDDLKDIFKLLSDDPHTIGNSLFQAITEYPIVKTDYSNYPGSRTYTYRIRRDGDTNYLHIVIDGDGHIVTIFTTHYIIGEGTFV